MPKSERQQQKKMDAITISMSLYVSLLARAGEREREVVSVRHAF